MLTPCKDVIKAQFSAMSAASALHALDEKLVFTAGREFELLACRVVSNCQLPNDRLNVEPLRVNRPCQSLVLCMLRYDTLCLQQHIGYHRRFQVGRISLLQLAPAAVG